MDKHLILSLKQQVFIQNDLNLFLKDYGLYIFRVNPLEGEITNGKINEKEIKQIKAMLMN